MASCFGLWAVSNDFVLLYCGEEFTECAGVIKLMCPIILIVGLGDIVRSQYLYPMKRDRTMTIITICNAMVNLILSALLIPRLGVYGAVIGTMAAEMFGLVTELYICRSVLSLSDILKCLLPFTVIGFIMYIAVKLVAALCTGTLLALLLQIAVGGTLFVLLSALYLWHFDCDLHDDMSKLLHKISGKHRKN